MTKYTKQKYFVNGKIPQDQLCIINAKKAELAAEICEIDALIAQHNANVLKEKSQNNE